MKLMVDPAFPDHVKIRKLAIILKINPYQAVGHVLAMWCRVMQQRETGDLYDWDELDVATVSGWTGEPKNYTEALIKTGFIERKRGKLLVHEWIEHQGDIIQFRKNERDRQKKHRMSRVTNADVTRESRTPPPVPSPPSPSLPIPSLPLPPERPSAHSHTAPAAIVSEWNRGPGFAISHEAGQKLVRAYIDSGMPAEKIHELVSNQPACKGRKLYEVLEPHRKKAPGSNGVASIEQILEKFGRGEIPPFKTPDEIAKEFGDSSK